MGGDNCVGRELSDCWKPVAKLDIDCLVSQQVGNQKISIGLSAKQSTVYTGVPLSNRKSERI